MWNLTLLPTMKSNALDSGCYRLQLLSHCQMSRSYAFLCGVKHLERRPRAGCYHLRNLNVQKGNIVFGAAMAALLVGCGSEDLAPSYEELSRLSNPGRTVDAVQAMDEHDPLSMPTMDLVLVRHGGKVARDSHAQLTVSGPVPANSSKAAFDLKWLSDSELEVRFKHGIVYHQEASTELGGKRIKLKVIQSEPGDVISRDDRAADDP